MISTAKDGGTVTNYSPRFSLTGLTGTTLATYVRQVTALQGSTAGPATVNDVNPAAAAPAKGAPAAAAPAAPAEDPALFTVPFNLQTGVVRYAPMQPVPPTKITADDVTPLFPTSPFDIARTKLPPPTIVTTYTLAQTYSVQSMQNTVGLNLSRLRKHESPPLTSLVQLPAAPPPQDDMAKYLNRWKD